MYVIVINTFISTVISNIILLVSCQFGILFIYLPLLNIDSAAVAVFFFLPHSTYCPCPFSGIDIKSFYFTFYLALFLNYTLFISRTVIKVSFEAPSIESANILHKIVFVQRVFDFAGLCSPYLYGL